jgi:hypothetical protein
MAKPLAQPTNIIPAANTEFIRRRVGKYSSISTEVFASTSQTTKASGLRSLSALILCSLRPSALQNPSLRQPLCADLVFDLETVRVPDAPTTSEQTSLEKLLFAPKEH